MNRHRQRKARSVMRGQVVGFFISRKHPKRGAVGDGVLDQMKKIRANEWVFPSANDKPFSEEALRVVLKRMNRKDIPPHGMRSAFRDWAAETANYANHVVEMALAHEIGSAVEAAYRRGDLIEKRKLLMADWGRHCTTAPADTGKVIEMQKATRKRA